MQSYTALIVHLQVVEKSKNTNGFGKKNCVLIKRHYNMKEGHKHNVGKLADTVGI